MKCPECGSEKLEYLPNVDGASWVNVKYKQVVNGKWKIVVTDDADFSTTGFRMQVLNTTGNGGVADFNVNCIMVLGDN